MAESWPVRRWYRFFGRPLTTRIQGYGMTETNAYVCSVAGADYVERVSWPGLPRGRSSADVQPDSTGPPVPICDVRIVDPETHRQVESGQTGLLMVRGPQVMQCYLDNEGDLLLRRLWKLRLNG
jgi:acyl-CoA synthetase (AMP-forming)/AMP-acid ligase II